MMKRLLLTILALSASAWAGTCGDNYNYGPIKLTLQKASGSDQTNFPYPIVSAYAPASLVTAMKTAANGGQIQNTAANSISVTGPADLVFCDAASAGNALKYETAMWSATTGAFEFWVQIPTLHTASNDSIYLFANNSAVSTTQQDISLWADANYKAVYHCSSLTTDSAGNFNLTNSGAASNSTTTILGNSCYFNGAATMAAASSTGLGVTTVSVEFWVNPVTNGTSNANYYVLDGNFNAGGWVVRNWNAKLDWVGNRSGALYVDRSTPDMLVTSQWQYLAETVTGTTRTMYRNAASQAFTLASGTSGVLGTTVIPLQLGADQTGAANFANAYMDEIRVSTDVKTTNWIATNYNVQSGASTPYLTSAAPSTANIVQQAVCWSAATSTPVGCTLPFPVTSGDTLVWSTETYNGAYGDCAAIGSHFADTLSTSYTMMGRVTSLGNAEQCLLFGVAPSTGANTVTYTPSAGTGGPVIWVAELDGMSSPATDATNTATQSGANSSIPTGSATATTSNSFYVCTAGNTNGSRITAGTPGTFIQIPIVLTVSGSSNTAGFTYAFTGSGANSCTFTTVSGSSARAQSGLIGILKYSLTTSTVRHRVVRH